MKTLTKNAFYALVATSLLSACSRPYATFQKTTPEHFYTKTTAAPAEAPVVVADAPVAVETPVTEAIPVQPTVATVQTQVNDMLVANKTALASDKKLEKRMNRVQNLLAANGTKEAMAPAKVSTKMSLMAKMVTKKINKQIEKKLAPKAAQTQSAVRLGIIVGIIGLLLVIIGNGFFAGLGAVLLVIGLLGILLGYLDVL